MKALWEKYKVVFFYLVFGALTTIINIVTFAVCYGGEIIPGVLTIEGLGIPNVPSNIIAWALAVTVAYITSKLWVFDSKSFERSVLLPEIWKFISCRLATGAMDLVIMWVGVDILHGPATILKVGSNVLVIILNYIFSKFVIFKKQQ